MTEVIDRAGWNARPPKYVNVLDWDEVVYFVVHYSGASRSQTVRSIQNYCMDTKKHSDIDYNELIRDGKLYIGRGSNKGGHTLNLNSKSYGVCIIGQDGDATAEDLRVLQERYRYACDRAGRMLVIVGHREAPGQDPTDCPGSEILGWIHGGIVDDLYQGDIPSTPPVGGDWTAAIMAGLPVARLGHHSRTTVKRIQSFMNTDLGEGTLLEDGVWGPKTDVAVRRWQVVNNVPNSVRSDGTGDGVFGRRSWEFALNLD